MAIDGALDIGIAQAVVQHAVVKPCQFMLVDDDKERFSGIQKALDLAPVILIRLMFQLR